MGSHQHEKRVCLITRYITLVNLQSDRSCIPPHFFLFDSKVKAKRFYFANYVACNPLEWVKRYDSSVGSLCACQFHGVCLFLFHASLDVDLIQAYFIASLQFFSTPKAKPVSYKIPVKSRRGDLSRDERSICKLCYQGQRYQTEITGLKRWRQA